MIKLIGEVNYMEQYKLPKRKLKLITKEFLQKELKNKTQKQISNEIGCDASLISKYKKKFNLQREGMTYQQINNQWKLSKRY